jgi:maltose O-acetyltransferase
MTRLVRHLVLKVFVTLPILPGELRVAILRACGLTIGAGSTIRSGCIFTDKQVSLGDGCFVNFGVTFDAAAPITIGDNVTIAYGVTLATSTHEIGDSTSRAGDQRKEPIRIEDGCWLGARSTVLPGVSVGSGCIIAAGALVARDCEPNGLYGGVPARRLRELACPDGQPAELSEPPEATAAR